MVWLLRYCLKCERYTINQEKCQICGGKVKIPHPARFSIDDRYRKYKLKLKRHQRNIDKIEYEKKDEPSSE